MAPKRRKLNPKKASIPSPKDTSPEVQAEEQSTQHLEEDTPSEQEPISQKFTLPFPDKPEKTISCVRHDPHRDSSTTSPSQRASLIFTHGAGGGLESAAIKDFAHGFAKVAGIVCFQGTMHMGSRVKAFGAVVENEDVVASSEGDGEAKGQSAGEVDVALGGRSMGARAAAMLASSPEYDGRVRAVVLVSFPLVSAKGDRREEVLLGLPKDVDVLFVSGSRDGMCDLQDLEEVTGRMEGKTWLMVVDGADHGMELRKKSVGGKEMREKSGEVAAQWLQERDGEKRHGIMRWDEDEGKVVCEWHNKKE